jgi:hypothetical protein
VAKGMQIENIFSGVDNSLVWKKLEIKSDERKRRIARKMLETKVIWIEENITPLTFDLSPFALKCAMYLVEPSGTPIADTITKIFNKTSANDKIPYSLCVTYRMIMTFPINVKTRPMKVPRRTIVVPFATLNNDSVTIPAIFH